MQKFVMKRNFVFLLIAIIVLAFSETTFSRKSVQRKYTKPKHAIEKVRQRRAEAEYKNYKEYLIRNRYDYKIENDAIVFKNKINMGTFREIDFYRDSRDRNDLGLRVSSLGRGELTIVIHGPDKARRGSHVHVNAHFDSYDYNVSIKAKYLIETGLSWKDIKSTVKANRDELNALYENLKGITPEEMKTRNSFASRFWEFVKREVKKSRCEVPTIAPCYDNKTLEVNGGNCADFKTSIQNEKYADSAIVLITHLVGAIIDAATNISCKKA